jgi:hypothetical protein
LRLGDLGGRYKIWLYAGTSEYPALLAAREEHRPRKGSENVSGADNQQERPLASRSPHDAAESSEAIRRTRALSRVKIWSDLHGDMQLTQMPKVANPGSKARVCPPRK